MKNAFESPETLAACATIEAGYFMLQTLERSYSKILPKSTIERMVDKATGNDRAMVKKYATSAIECLKDIIEAKKVLEADATGDEKMILKLQTLIKN